MDGSCRGIGGGGPSCPSPTSSAHACKICSISRQIVPEVKNSVIIKQLPYLVLPSVEYMDSVSEREL